MAEEIMGAASAASETAGSAAAAQEVVAPAAESVTDENAAQQATEGKGDTQPSDSGKKQTSAENSRMAALRRKAEAHDKNSAALMAYARSKGLQPSDAAEAIEMLQAQEKGVSLEVFRKEQSDALAAETEKVKSSDAYKELERRLAGAEKDALEYRAQRQMQEDLRAIREVDSSVESLESLEGYDMLVERGITGLDAYYLLKGRAAVTAQAMPPSTGTVGGSDNGERDFTGEELDRLDKELDDPNVLKRAIRSLTKLR